MKKSQLMKKMLFAAGVLALYRLGTYIPMPMINITKLAEFAAVAKSGIFGMFNIFSGGSMARVSIFGLGIMPYITSSIIIQLLAASIPAIKNLKSEGGEAAQKKLGFYTRVLTIAIGLLQGFVFAGGFVSMGLYSGIGNIFMFKCMIAFTLMVSTMIVLWLGEMITAHGIGNGSSLIIFAGIVAEAPKDLINVFTLSKNGNLSAIMLIVLFAIFFATVMFVVFCERSNRLIYIQYPRQTQNFIGRKSTLPQQNFLPLKLNTAGVVPPIFASAMLLLPATILTIFDGNNTEFGGFVLSNFAHGKPIFAISYVMLIIFFSFFYNSTIFDAEDIANNLKRSSIFIPNCRPGEQTVELLRSILKRLAVIGAGYLSVVCLVPEILSPIYGYSFLLGGTGVLIVVNVIVDTFVGIQTSILSQKYERKMKKYERR